MARLTITIASDNDALIDPDNSDLEVNEILGRIKAKIYDQAGPSTAAEGKIYDSNGGAVGTWEWIPGVTES